MRSLSRKQRLLSAKVNLEKERTGMVAGTYRWKPQFGDETARLIKHLNLPHESAARIQEEASDVLSKCVPTDVSSAQETGLVIGYVQSGKTMSFTTVAALARDNNYRLVIVISGITTKLFEQSSDRIEADLQIKTGRRWQFFRNPKSQPDVIDRISAALDWGDVPPGFDKQTVLITVMKNGAHLRNLAGLLAKLPSEGVPTLIIDDEADQASLNNLVRRNEESATYRRIVRIRALLPTHTFLQYTATPQAPLLINLIDTL